MKRCIRLGVSAVFLLCLVSGCASARKNQNTADTEATGCIGPEHALRGAVYLHGIDSARPSMQELRNRSVLSALARRLKMRIAIPRGTASCPGNSICWGWGPSDNEARDVLRAIEEASAFCGLPVARLGLIGFSNGGYMTAKLFRDDLFKLAGVSWGVAAGSAMWRGSIAPRSQYVSGRLVMIIGERDVFNRDPKQNYLEQLRRISGDVHLVEFPGGHELPFNETLKAVEEALSGHN